VHLARPVASKTFVRLLSIREDSVSQKHAAMSLLPTTNQEANQEVVQHTRFAMLTGMVNKLKENAAVTFKEVR
jgi:hypothetical protein